MNQRYTDVRKNKESFVSLPPNPDWYDGKIQAENWNASFPYQLMLVKEKKTGQIVETEGFSVAGIPIVERRVEPKGTNTYSLFKEDGVKSSFTLPIHPENISLSLPFASDLSFTLGGTVEEHSGAPLRIIAFSGTTGVAPFRKSTVMAKPTGVAGALASAAENRFVRGLAGGAINAAQTALDRIKDVVGSPSELHIHHGDEKYKIGGRDSGLTDEENQTGIMFDTTGYYQFHLLRKFLENYAAMKTLDHYKDVKLALAIWKDSAVYLVTPQQFSLQRQADSPLEYRYSLQFKAWKRIELSGGAPSPYEHTTAIRSPNIVASILRSIDVAKSAITGVGAVASAVVGDINAVAKVFKEASLTLKSAATLPITVGDLVLSVPSELERTWDSIKEDIDDIGKQWDRAGDRWRGNKTSNTKEREIEELNKKLENAETASISSLPPKMQEAARREIQAAANQTKDQLIEQRDKLQEVADSIANTIGASSPTYNEIYGVKADLSTKEPSIEEVSSVLALSTLVQGLDSAISERTIQQDPIIPSSMEYVAALANQSGITFEEANNYFSVPVPYNVSLERIAVMYLGDADRWHEIATLNGLRAPYIDEEGFVLPLLVDAKDNKVVVSSVDNLLLDQLVTIRATGLVDQKRRIVSIEEESGSFILTLSGKPDLDLYTVGLNAELHSYFPYTTNSSQVLLIPSPEFPEEDVQAPEGVDKHDVFLKSGGVDLLLTEDGDIAVNASGEVRYAYGLANIIQNIKLALTTKRGSLIRHPDFGLSLDVGDSTSEITASDIIKEIEDTLSGDPALQDISSVKVNRRSGVTELSFVISVAGLNETIPVSFVIN